MNQNPTIKFIVGKTLGEIGELKFMLRATEKGFVVSKPFGDNCDYDFIIEKDSKLYRAQVKSTFREPNGAGKFDITTSHGSKQKLRYDKSKIDLIAAYIYHIDTFYLIPIENIKSKKKICIYPSRDTCPWKNFKGDWNLCKAPSKS